MCSHGLPEAVGPAIMLRGRVGRDTCCAPRSVRKVSLSTRSQAAGGVALLTRQGEVMGA